MPSPKMLELMSKKSEVRKPHNLRLEEIPEGESITIPYDEISIAVLRSTAYRAGKKLNCKFSVLIHKELELFEVGRIPNATA